MALDLAIALVDQLLADLQHGEPKSEAAPDSPSGVPSDSASIPFKGKKQKKAKVKSPAVEVTKPDAAAPSSLEDPIQKACLQVGQVIAVEEFESDKLYCCQVLVADGQTKQIIAGLRKHVPKDQLLNQLVVVILNLKTAKLAGKLSEGMILAAVHASSDGSELVHPLRPAGDSNAGDAVLAKGIEPVSPQPKALKSEIWRSIAAELKTCDGMASYKGSTLQTIHGDVQTHSSIPEGSPIR